MACVDRQFEDNFPFRLRRFLRIKGGRGQYVLTQQLGQSRYSRAWLCETADGGQCVLKFIPQRVVAADAGPASPEHGVVAVAPTPDQRVQQALGDRAATRLGSAGSRFLAAIREAFVVTDIEADVDVADGSLLALVMDYVNGINLEDLFSVSTGAPEGVVSIILREICLALSCFHAHGIEHRELSPSNVIVGNDGRVWFCDFQAERRAFDASSKRNACTEFSLGPLFLAPELAKEWCTRTRSAGTLEAVPGAMDIWSFGAMAYSMLDGSPPHLDLAKRHAPLPEVLLEIANRRAPRMRSQVSRAALQIVSQCLSPLPERRPTADALLEKDFLLEMPRGAELLVDYVESQRELLDAQRTLVFDGDSEPEENTRLSV